MGNNKKTIGLSIALILLVLIFALASCSPVKRHARLVKKFPFVHQTDTVILRDTLSIIVPKVQHDTIMLLDSFILALKDTITIEKDNLTVKITEIHDSIYIEADCDTVYLDKIIIKKIPIKYYEVNDGFCVKNYAKYIGLIFLIFALMIIAYKFLKLLK